LLTVFENRQLENQGTGNGTATGMGIVQKAAFCTDRNETTAHKDLAHKNLQG